MSTAGVYVSPLRTSGAMYAGVPHWLVRRARAVFIFFASPKSAMRSVSSLTRFLSTTRVTRSTTRPFSAKIKFSSFKSRCAMFLACIVSRPVKSRCMTTAASRSRNAPSFVMASSRSPPRSSSMTTYTCVGAAFPSRAARVPPKRGNAT